MKSQALGQAGGQLLIRIGAFVQRHHADAGGQHAVQAVTLQQHLAAIEHAAKARSRAHRHALGHSQHQHAAIGLCQQALQRYRAACLQRGAQIQAT